MEKAKRPSLSESQLERAEKSFDSFNEEVKTLSGVQPFNPDEGATDPQTKMGREQFKKADAPYIKPTRYISCSSKERFNPEWQKLWDREKEYVKVIVENNEIIGESVELWHKNWPTQHAEFWQVPVNKPVYIPRGVATQITKCRYKRLKTVDRPIDQVLAEASHGGGIGFTQGMVAAETTRRLDCRNAEGF